ncbi:twin-arginine translocation signal domain-containing protein [Crenobacter sp. SG2303]|uniref:Twin-arginine translocation signal domain-containing protein n=1 Tax=Crenobacter oryzisoli TaxID=3056844 RepID=A0ABT7XIK1_9NEIS|nr:twin-arginine translocation signal domain-containing protein [Crenobacter sp. SG2303]MDN0073623.1 twin-arginine translocation signal domain-containing protein [Crenobacter sp. SG2303]
MLTRRQLIKTGAVGAVALVAAAYLAGPAEERTVLGAQPLGFLTSHDMPIVRAIAPAMLGLAPGGANPSLDELVAGVDKAILALPIAVQQEVRELFDLLQNRWLRRWLAGVHSPWADVRPDEAAAFLARWQDGAFVLLRTGYQALHKLINAAWYGNPKSWAGIGYQQPARVMEVLP